MKPPDWTLLRAFHATATTGSLSAAARQLGLTQPTLSRQIAALEADLGLRLFDRIGRRLVLTEAGAGLVEPARAMAAAAETAALAAGGQGRALAGRVRLSVTDTAAAYQLPASLARIRQAAPGITVEIIASNGFSDLHRHEADIALRHAAPDRDTLAGLRLPDSEVWMCAARAWVDRHGLPATPADLPPGCLIGFDDAERYAAHLRSIGLAVEAGDFRLVSASSVAVWEMARHGLGVAAMLREVAAATPGMVRLLPDLPRVAVPVWLITHRDLQGSPRIRAVLSILAQDLGGPAPGQTPG